MSQTTSNAQSKTDQLPADMVELQAAIAELPIEHRAKVETIYNRVCESSKRRRRILALVQDALSQLRLDMKYLVFDLEATRRERDDYRSQLENEGEKGGEF